VFDPEERERLRRRLLDRAEADPRLAAAAVTGSRAEGREDRWSDIDLFFGVQGPVGTALEEWTAFAYRELAAVHHFELRSGPATYRAFLLPDALQLDLGFTPVASFGPAGDGAFDLVFGSAGPRQPRPPDVDFLVGMGWHHVVHARSAIERGRPWRAEYWLSSLRDVVLGLASVRHGRPHSYARSADDLPEEVTAALRRTLVADLEPATLTAALTAGTAALLVELRHVDDRLADRLAHVLEDRPQARNRP
jgi:hypothetical protein